MDHILIVEDHKDFREAVKKYISIHGVSAELWEAMTGEEGVEIASRKKPELVIMDVHLGVGMNGLEAASLIKKNDPACGIIVLTMFGNSDMKNLCKSKDISAFIDKGDLDKELIPAIKRLLPH